MLYSKIKSNLSEMLLHNISNPSYSLTISEKNWIINFIHSSSNSFDKMGLEISDIIKDNKINLSDIPFIIKLIVDIYQVNSLKLEMIHPENLITFNKYVLYILLQPQMTFLYIDEIEFINRIIESSLSLLTTNLKKEEYMKQSFSKKNYCFMYFF
jgi:hypothetical protein